MSFSAQAPVREQQSGGGGGVPPVVTVRLLSQNPLGVQARVGGTLLPEEGQRGRAPVHLQARVKTLLHQGPQPGPRVAAPGVRPEGDGEGLGLVHRRGQRLLRIS